ncbi:hypothetical protein LSH36_992g01042, partial [Paralvinella palmiformis]
MLVRDQVQVLHAGQTLELSCEFYMEGFDLFDNPIIWKKVQRNEEKNINIMAPVRSIAITKGNRSITDTDIQRTLEFTEDEYTSLRCGSFGGCPPPEMTLYLGKHEITNQFSLDYTSELSGVIGLRLIEHTTIRWSDRFRVTSDHDNV